jgi:hypothetical protein
MVFSCARQLLLAGPGRVSLPPGGVRYGFVARAEADWLLARWTDNEITLALGRSLPAAEVLAAFGQKAP